MTTPEPAKPKKRKKLRRAGLVTLIIVLLLAFGAAGTAMWAIGRSFTAPFWLQSRIETRLAQEMPNARVYFGDMTLVVDRGWTPRIRLRDVQIATLENKEIASFSEFRTSLSMPALLQGQIQPSSLSISGAFATIRRRKSGGISLSAGVAGQANGREAATLGALVKQLDGLVAQPFFSKLKTAELRALTLQLFDDRAGRIWTIDGGRLIAERSQETLALTADLAVLGGGADVATLTANYTSQIGAPEASFGFKFEDVAAEDIATQSPAFAWLEVLRAPISGSVRSGVNADGTLAPLSGVLHIAEGVMQPNAQTKPVPFQRARSYFSYDAGAGILQFDELSVQSKWITGSAEGTATLAGLREGKLEQLVGQFTLKDLRANPQELYPEPIALETADVDFRLQLHPFRMDLGRLQITDQGRTLQAHGHLEAKPEGWELALDAHIDAITPKRLLGLWPKSLKTRTRDWLNRNLLAANITDADLAVRRHPNGAPQTYLAFQYDNAEVKYMKSLPPLVQARGHASLDADRFVIMLDKGQVKAPKGGLVQLGGSSFILPDVRVRGGTPAVLRMRSSSSVTAGLSLLDLQPLRLMSRAGLATDFAEGQVAAQAQLSFPLKRGTKPSDVVFDVTGTATGVSSSTLIKGRKLEARSLRLVANNKGLDVAGKGQLDGVAFEGGWRQPIGKGANQSVLRGVAQVTPKALETFGIALPEDTVRGSGPADVKIVLSRGKAPSFEITSALRGIRISIPQLAWTKPPSAKGTLKIAGNLGSKPTIDQLEISGSGLRAKGDLRLKSGGGLDRLSISRLELNNWLDIPVDLVGRGAGKPPQIVVKGGSMDMRRATFGGDGGGGKSSNGTRSAPNPPMIVALDRLQITDTIALRGMQGTFQTTGGLAGPFEARLNGGTRVSGKVTPQGKRSAVTVVSNDAGGVFRSAGVLDQAVGGSLSLTLLPVGSGGAFDGRLKVLKTRIKDAPSMAALLNAISVVGLLDQMNGEGIYFEEVEADFRLTPNRMTLTKASAVGASMGISMDGIFQTDTGQIAMQGVITPVYLLNGLASVLTRKGEGVFGFNYRLSGLAKSPKVSINPLSALAPGLLRDAFRAPQTQLPEVEGVATSTLPESEPTVSTPVVDAYEGR